MSKTKFLLVCLILILLVGVSIRANPYTGFYQGTFDILYCDRTPDTCRHEVAHLMDKQLGYPSRSERFGLTVYMQVYTQIRLDAFDAITNTIIFMPGMFVYSDLYNTGQPEMFSSPQEELYAKLYALVRGDICKLPQGLQQFYSDDPQYNDIYQILKDRGFYHYQKTIQSHIPRRNP